MRKVITNSNSPYKKRYVSGLTALFFLATTLCFAQEAKRNNAAPGKALTQPSWVADYPMVLVCDHDIKLTFRRRVGANPEWMDDAYAQAHTEERIKKFKEMGATVLVMNFYKGFGLTAEKEEIEDAKKEVALCKKYGLKIAAYIGATMAYETFLAEMPEAKAWIVPDYMGQPVTYGSQTFRKLVYFQHEGYKAYIKRVLKIAIEDFKVDMIHFDNSSVQGIPPVFYHPLAAENFRTFLKHKYTPAQLKQRFGFSDVSYVEPPPYNKNVSRMYDPLLQEWTDFRCQQLADYYGEMAKYIRELNPEVAVECNPHGLAGMNTMWQQSVDFPRILAHSDFFWTEGEKTGLMADGVLISKIRTFKMGRTLNNRVLVNTTNKLEMAETMAYDRQGLGLIGGMTEIEGGNLGKEYHLSDDEKEYVKFFHKQFDYYRDVTNIADVAVLHSYATMTYDSDRPYQSTFLFEQSLIQSKIPFDIIFDDQLNNLGKYKVLVLADQECLTEEQLNLIRNFVSKGGGLVATEHTSLYTDWYRRKADFGLRDLFKVQAPEWHLRSKPEDILKIPVQKNQIGKGRVVYIPEVRAAVPKPTAAAMSGKYLKLPLNNQELIESVKWASGDNLSLYIDGPETVTMELTEKTDKSAMLLHLVNFNYQKSAVQNIHVDVKVPAGKKVKQVMILSPDNTSENVIPFKENSNRATFTVPQLAVYDVVVMKLK
ncbi:hypothetical protein FW774_09215 [Pedobacter sp. BS3]|uniref:alpha-amylase family protein n=1 Tax=Pedobacter sp. BS3 TaxID=2567937 RepID=UPI0011EF6E15|nr:alpha-amylase family protein [Pedobacter sp. BS3]TZF83645.1 hypothetical protein FW774_09215 [Pedobacter sp. BS3]